MSYEGNPGQRWGHITYAQHGDDLFLINVFALIGIQKGTYIDIGAHHPFDISNTALLYERGWTGVNIEANPKLMANFYQHRPRDVNINAGVTPLPGSMPFFIFDDYDGRNTFSEKERDEIITEGRPLKTTIQVDTITLQKILIDEPLQKQTDLLLMDAEGLDLQILKSCDLSFEGAPKVVCVEVRPHEAWDFIDAMRFYDYFILARTGANLIFVKNKYKNIMLQSY